MGWTTGGDNIRFTAEGKPRIDLVNPVSATLADMSVAAITDPGATYDSTVDLSGFAPPGTSAVSPYTWGTYDVTLESVPTLHVTGIAEQEYDDLPDEVTGSVSVPSDTAETFSGTQPTDTLSISIPTVPDITLGVFSEEAPEFDVEATDGETTSWVYDAYTSTLLTALIAKSDLLADGDLLLSTTDATARNTQIWSRQSMFAASRGVPGLNTRWLEDRALFSAHIQRLITIITADQAEKNTQVYIETRQALENLERGMYDARAKGQLGFAKAYTENLIDRCKALVSSYNALLQQYRVQAFEFETDIENQRIQLAHYKAEVEGEAKKGEVNEILLEKYLSQINVVNDLAKSYEITASVSEKIANIALLSADMTRLNAESFVLRSKALARQTDARLYFTETELRKKELVDAQLEYDKAELEKANLSLQADIEVIRYQIGQTKNTSDYERISRAYDNLLARATLFEELTNAQLDLSKERADSERAGIARKVESIENTGDMKIDSIGYDITTANSKTRNAVDLVDLETRKKDESDVIGYTKLYDAEWEVAEKMHKAATAQAINQIIIAGS